MGIPIGCERVPRGNVITLESHTNPAGLSAPALFPFPTSPNPLQIQHTRSMHSLNFITRSNRTLLNDQSERRFQAIRPALLGATALIVRCPNVVTIDIRQHILLEPPNCYANIPTSSPAHRHFYQACILVTMCSTWFRQRGRTLAPVESFL